MSTPLPSKLLTSINVAKAMTLTLKHMWLVPKGNPPREVIAKFAKEWARELLEAFNIKVEVTGEAPPWGVLHAANHRSFMDILVLMYATPGTFLSKAEVAKWPIIGAAAKLAGTVFVRRDIKDSRLAARETLRELLQNGDSVTVFPEGTTRSIEDPLVFKYGSFEVTAETGSSVVPIAIEYPRVDDAWINNEPIGQYYHRVYNRPMTVQVRIGPIMTGEDGPELAEKAQKWVNDQLQDMHEQLHK